MTLKASLAEKKKLATTPGGDAPFLDEDGEIPEEYEDDVPATPEQIAQLGFNPDEEGFDPTPEQQELMLRLLNS